MGDLVVLEERALDGLFMPFEGLLEENRSTENDSQTTPTNMQAQVGLVTRPSFYSYCPCTRSLGVFSRCFFVILCFADVSWRWSGTSTSVVLLLFSWKKKHWRICWKHQGGDCGVFELFASEVKKSALEMLRQYFVSELESEDGHKFLRPCKMREFARQSGARIRIGTGDCLMLSWLVWIWSCSFPFFSSYSSRLRTTTPTTHARQWVLVLPGGPLMLLVSVSASILPASQCQLSFADECCSAELVVTD